MQERETWGNKGIVYTEEQPHFSLYKTLCKRAEQSVMQG